MLTQQYLVLIYVLLVDAHKHINTSIMSSSPFDILNDCTIADLDFHISVMKQFLDEHNLIERRLGTSSVDDIQIGFAMRMIAECNKAKALLIETYSEIIIS